MDKLELTFEVEKDTKNTRHYQEEATDGPPIIRHALHSTAGASQADREKNRIY